MRPEESSALDGSKRDAPPPDHGQRLTARAVEIELVREDECRIDPDDAVDELAGAVRQEAPDSVSAEHVEAEDTAKRPVQDHVDDAPELDVAKADPPLQQRLHVQTPIHPAQRFPRGSGRKPAACPV